jgi:hypothetical protein
MMIDDKCYVKFGFFNHFIFECFQGQDHCMNCVVIISDMIILVFYNLSNILAHYCIISCIISYNIFITHFFNYLTNNVNNVCSHVILL